MRSVLTAVVLAVAFVAPAATQDEVYKPGNGVRSPVLIKEVKPNYTPDAIKRRVEGVVEMECVVLTDGTVRDDIKVTRSLDGELDQQAVIALKQWRFRPGTKDDKPVPVKVNVEMTFTLKK